MTRMLAAILFTLWLSTPLPAAAQQAPASPFIYVLPAPTDGNVAWWLNTSIIRPMGTVVSGVSVDRLNAHREDAATGPWCFADALSNRSFASPVREIQLEIDASMADGAVANFAVSGAFTGGMMLDAVVGNYETCDGHVGAFILITDRAPTPDIVYLDEWENWRGLIWLRHGDDALVVGSCFECGHADSLFYDSRRRRFYWESTGD